jgi:hypothetical protein
MFFLKFSSIFVSIGGSGRYSLLMLGLFTQLSFFYLKGNVMEFDFSQLENYVAPPTQNFRWFVQWNCYTYDKSSFQYGQWQDAKNWNPERLGSDKIGGHTSEIMAHAHAAEARRWSSAFPNADPKYRVVKREFKHD